MMTSHIAKALAHLFPGTVAGVDYQLQDDGGGPYIREWNLPCEMPDETVINQAAVDIGLEKA